MPATADRRAADLAVMELLLLDPTLTECEARRQLAGGGGSDAADPRHLRKQPACQAERASQVELN